MNDIGFSINEEKKTVVAYIKLPNEEIAEVIREHMATCLPLEFIDIHDDVLKDIKFTGKARCSVVDEFDESVGKALALERLNAKFDKVISRIFKNILIELMCSTVRIAVKLRKYIAE